MADGQYATDLMGQIEEDLKKYHKSDDGDPSGVMDYHKNDMYQNDDDPLNQDYHTVEEEEEKNEDESPEFEEEDQKYSSEDEDEADFLKKDSDEGWRQWQRKKGPVRKKTKSTIEDAIVKAQEEIVRLD